MGVQFNVEGVTRWKSACLRAAEGFLTDGQVDAMSTWQLDQMTAAARDAGLSEREQGVFLLAMLLAEVEKRPWAERLTPVKRAAVATAITVRMLQQL